MENALPNAKICRLDSLYPTYQFDIEAEQSAILDADVIVFQFPFSWYSVPCLMELRIDKIFIHGFAHGSMAKIGSKKLIISTTAGAPAEIYQKDGFSNIPWKTICHNLKPSRHYTAWNTYRQ